MASTDRLNPADFTTAFGAAARRTGLRSETLAEIDGLPLVAYTKRTPGPRPRVYLSAGIHGDEPAPPQALLRLAEQGFLDQRCTWFVCPLLNPAGMARGTRHNRADVDLNRDYRHGKSAEVRAHVGWLQRQPNFDLSICLHEDWEATGFYLYELVSGTRPGFAAALVAAARRHGPIEPATVVDGRPVTSPGVIHPSEDPLLRETWPEAIYLRTHHAEFGYTIETASGPALAGRVDTHCAVVTAAIAALLA